jgi:poly(3-hydroxybutyrate) depolymerase
MTKIMKKLSVLVLFSMIAALPHSAHAVYGAPGKVTPVAVGTNGAPMGFYEYLPPDYSETSGKKFPVVLFLHGNGETGNGTTQLSKLLGNDPLKFLAAGTKSLPAIVIAPQSASPWNTYSVPLLDSLLDKVFKTYAADPDRLYVTGLSGGGDGAFTYARAHPDRPAAIVPICPPIYPWSFSDAPNLVDLPIWAFHATNDTTVQSWNTTDSMSLITPPPADKFIEGYTSGKDGTALYSRSAAKHAWTLSDTSKVVDLDTRLRLTLYASGGHAIWGRVYNNPDMWNWMFSFKRGGLLVSDSPSTPIPTPNVSPTVNGGVDKVITLPTNSVSLAASATDTDGTILSYAWSKVSGGAAVLSNASSASVSITGLVEGTYVFRVTVADNQGLSASDDVQVIVNPAPVVTPPPVTDPLGQVIKIDFGNGGATANWNNASTTVSSLDLKDTAGNLTGVKLVTVKDLKRVNGDGTRSASPSLNLPAFATQDSFYGNDVEFNGTLPVMTYEFQGLIPNQDYTFEFFASRMNVTDTRQTQYKLSTATSSQVVNLDVANNTSKKAVLSQVKANSNGVIRLDVQKGAGNTNPYGFFYLGNIVIHTGTIMTAPPMVNAGSDQVVTLPTNQAQLTALATDSDGAITSYQWTKVSGGSAVLNGATTTAMTASGLTEGTYVFRVTVTDNKGATASDDVMVTVNPAPVSGGGSTSQIRVDFGQATTVEAGWNGFYNIGSTAAMKLVNGTGAATNVELVMTSRFNDVNLNGTTSPNSALSMPAFATRDNVYGNSVQFGNGIFPKAILQVRNLDPNKTYSFQFFASRMQGGGENRESKYIVSGATSGSALLNANENALNKAVVSGIKPNASGVVTIEISKGPANNTYYGFFYLGNMIITF